MTQILVHQVVLLTQVVRALKDGEKAKRVVVVDLAKRNRIEENQNTEKGMIAAAAHHLQNLTAKGRKERSAKDLKNKRSK